MLTKIMFPKLLSPFFLFLLLQGGDDEDTHDDSHDYEDHYDAEDNDKGSKCHGSRKNIREKVTKIRNFGHLLSNGGNDSITIFQDCLSTVFPKKESGRRGGRSSRTA